jgi:hypothetical protein
MCIVALFLVAHQLSIMTEVCQTGVRLQLYKTAHTATSVPHNITAYFTLLHFGSSIDGRSTLFLVRHVAFLPTHDVAVCGAVA